MEEVTIGDDETCSETPKGTLVPSVPISFIHNSIDHRPVVVAHSSQSSFTIFLDTGSPVNLMDEKTFQFLYPGHVVTSSSSELTDIQGNPLRVRGAVALTYRIGSHSFRDTFSILEGNHMFPIVILGYDSCRKNNISIFPGRKAIRIGRNYFYHGHTLGSGDKDQVKDVGLPDVQHHTDNNGTRVNDVKGDVLLDKSMNVGDLVRNVSHNSVHSVSLVHNLKIGAGDSNHVWVKMKGVASGEHVLALPESECVKGLALTSALYQVRDRNLTMVEISNCLDRDLILKKGTK